MELEFTKMHGAGNDYIYFNCLEKELDDPSGIAIAMSERHFSVGADGIVMICSSAVADAKMRMFNADGSEGKMCGNAIRCVGKYLYDNKLTDKTLLKIETLSGIKTLSLSVENGKVQTVSVDMGKAILDGRQIPVDYDGTVKKHSISVNGEMTEITCVSMGNPHAVVFVENPADLDLEKIGPGYENHKFFPERVNTEFVKINSRNEITMRVWERGSGETFACGTGACASVVASAICEYVDFDTPVKVNLIGGSLTISCASDYSVTMNGSATTVYKGVYEYDN